MNGMNFIDGANGLMSAFFLSSLLNIAYLAYLTGDAFFSALCVLFFIPSAIFLLFNYPSGKIFAGDLGAYLKGVFVGYLVINFFASQPDVSLWSALIILFYPTAEVIFSCWRKITQGKSPLKPDRLHLHIKLYDLIYKATQKSRLANNLVVVFLSFFWLMPMLILPWVYDDTALVILTLVILSSIYLLLNHYIPETKPIEHKQRSMGRGAKAINKAG
jgi:UDP-N-acetylmuramyl pentapeptide phosphotransferase/UDP-N-acetylglucosamine-1-phosphate transferase